MLRRVRCEQCSQKFIGDLDAQICPDCQFPKTLYDEVAIAALQSIIMVENNPKFAAQIAFDTADAFMTERKKRFHN